MDKIWNSPFSVYIQRVIDLDDTSITHVSKIGKTIHSVNDREHKGYNPLGRSSSHSETEKHYKDTLRAGYIIEWYCINIPVQYISTVDLKNSVSFIHGKSPDIVESELREILKNRTGKKCLENIKPSDMPK